MQFVGFLKEQDPNIHGARSIEQMFQSSHINNDERSKIINYLESGVFLCGAMSYIYDDQDKPIGNLDYFTDGEFIWPVYFPYYLKKYDTFYIDKNFTESIKKRNYQIKSINAQELVEIENAFDREWGSKK